MSRMDFFRQGGTPFDGFLYANLGQDSNGNTVSVLSALARLGVDPWDEAAQLSGMSREGAQARLADLLSRVPDVSDVGRDPAGGIAWLIDLLPKSSFRHSAQPAALPVALKGMGVGPAIAGLLTVLFLLHTCVSG